MKKTITPVDSLEKKLHLFAYLFTTGPIPAVNLGIVCVCLSTQTHISVTAGRNFLILGTMMGYGLGMMPIILFYMVCHPRYAQTKHMSVSEIGSNGNKYTTDRSAATLFGFFSPMLPIT